MRFIGFYDYTVILTYLSLVSAVLGMVCAGKDNFSSAILCLMASGVFDMFDGRVARSKKNRTADEKAFGIQLDSLCDVICFGVFPALICYLMGVLCYCMGADTVIGIAVICCYCICAVIRLAFFNVMEAKRQQVEDGCNQFYRGLPVTTISMIYPAVYLLRNSLPSGAYPVVLVCMLAVVAFLFVLDVPIRKLGAKKEKTVP